MKDGNEASPVDVRLEGPLRLRTRTLPPSLLRRVVTIPVGGVLAPGSWHDEIVAVEEGGVDVLLACGGRLPLDVGAVLWLDGVAHLGIRCSGDVPAVLVAIRRARPSSPEAQTR